MENEEIVTPTELDETDVVPDVDEVIHEEATEEEIKIDNLDEPV